MTPSLGDSIGTSTWLGEINKQLKNNFLTGNQPGLLYNKGSDPSVPGPVPYSGTVDRMLTLNEDFDSYGRLIQTIGTFDSRTLDNQGKPTWGLPCMGATTEKS